MAAIIFFIISFISDRFMPHAPPSETEALRRLVSEYSARIEALTAEVAFYRQRAAVLEARLTSYERLPP